MNEDLPRRRVLLMLAVGLCAPGCAPKRVLGAEQADAPTAKTYKFTGGRWFDGKVFRSQTLYAAGGLFTRHEPARIDEAVDLRQGYVIPPFADAHTHHFDNPANIDRHIAMYLEQGVFYAKVQTDVRTRARLVADKINRADSVDVSYAHGGLSASNGHPLATYESLALFGRPFARPNEIETVRASRLRDNDAYYIIDTADDLVAKWPRIIAGRPDFLKIYLLYSEEYNERRDRTGTVGDRGLDPALVPSIVARAHASGLRVSAHVQTAADYRVALMAGVDEMAHLPGSTIPASADPRRYRLAAEDAAETTRRGTWVIPAPAYNDAFDPLSAAFDPKAKARSDAVRISNLRLLKDHRVRIALGSDSFGRSPVKDVLYLHSFGVFSNIELLRIWCEATPQTIFPERSVGRLADGYEASFLVLDGDPVADFSQIANIGLRFKQGRPITLGASEAPKPSR